MKLSEFYRRIQRMLEIDANEVRRTCDATLKALFARLTPDEARHLAAQLPHQLRDRFVVKRGFERLSGEEVVDRVAMELDCDDYEAIRRIRAVFRVVREAVSAGAVDHALEQLPADVQAVLE
jgi:uncharacterized protein (DUF2267 family)